MSSLDCLQHRRFGCGKTYSLKIRKNRGKKNTTAFLCLLLPDKPYYMCKSQLSAHTIIQNLCSKKAKKKTTVSSGALITFSRFFVELTFRSVMIGVWINVSSFNYGVASASAG